MSTREKIRRSIIHRPFNTEWVSYKFFVLVKMLKLLSPLVY